MNRFFAFLGLIFSLIGLSATVILSEIFFPFSHINDKWFLVRIVIGMAWGVTLAFNFLALFTPSKGELSKIGNHESKWGRLLNDSFGWVILAMMFSLMHAVIDIHVGALGLFGPTATVQLTSLVMLYAPWIVSVLLIKSRSFGRKRLPPLTSLAYSLVWATIWNGMSFTICPPPCPGDFPFQDIAHFGSIVSGLFAARISLIELSLGILQPTIPSRGQDLPR